MLYIYWLNFLNKILPCKKNIKNEWCVKINRSKTFTTLFTLSTKIKPVKIMLNHTELQHIDSATYLGVTFDRRQTWKPHICNAETKARCKLALLHTMGCSRSGIKERVHRNYTSTPRLWYQQHAHQRQRHRTIH